MELYKGQVMNLRKKWISIIYTVATGSRKIRMILTPIVALSYALFATLFVIASLFVDKLFNFTRFLKPPTNLYFSVPLISVGLFLVGWSQFNFFKVKGTPVPFNPPPKLVTAGPYKYVRNPMLSGIFMLLFGLGFAFRSLSLLLIFTPLFILINVMEIKAIEEPELEMRLGKNYLKYKKRHLCFSLK
jgi:protein-S-isoprenylcysteine O-methyltransferase Ste14